MWPPAYSCLFSVHAPLLLELHGLCGLCHKAQLGWSKTEQSRQRDRLFWLPLCWLRLAEQHLPLTAALGHTFPVPFKIRKVVPTLCAASTSSCFLPLVIHCPQPAQRDSRPGAFKKAQGSLKQEDGEEAGTSEAARAHRNEQYFPGMPKDNGALLPGLPSAGSCKLGYNLESQECPSYSQYKDSSFLNEP